MAKAVAKCTDTGEDAEGVESGLMSALFACLEMPE